MKSVFRRIFKAFLFFLILLLGIEGIIYLMAPIYDFPPPKPFSGDKWFNPYLNIDPAQWKRANFHFHGREWGGLTAGRNNTHEAFYQTYKALGYASPQISNYQRIDRQFSDSGFYIPVYEHGFGVRKKHQILIGAHHVLWLDYSLFQNVSHKQHILNLLRDDNEIVAIAHPAWEQGYSSRDMSLLSNYDLIEALDNNWTSIGLWDDALSSGHPVFILGDDDAHDISNPYQVGRKSTYINSSDASGNSIMQALKEGKAYGVDPYMYDGQTFPQKAVDAKKIPFLEEAVIRGDTFFVTVSDTALRFQFIGQEGKIRKISRFSDRAWYKLQPEDTYIRTEICFFNRWKGPGTRFYLNPVFRYNGEKPRNSLQASVNSERTWIFRILAFGSLGMIGYVYFRIRFRKKSNRKV